MSLKKNLPEIQQRTHIIKVEGKKAFERFLNVVNSQLNELYWKKEDDLKRVSKEMSKFEAYHELLFARMDELSALVNSLKVDDTKDVARVISLLKTIKDSISHAGSLTTAFEEQILAYFQSLEVDKSKLDGIHDAISDYHKVFGELWHQTDRLASLLTSLSKHKKAKAKKTPFRSLFYSYNRASCRFKGVIGKSQVFVETTSAVNVKRHHFQGKTVYDYIRDYLLEGPGWDDEGEQELFDSKLEFFKSISASDLEQELISIVHATILEILNSNLVLLKASRVSYKVKLVPESELKSSGGVYYVAETFASNYVLIRFSDGLIDSFIHGRKTISPDCKMYEHLVHEFTHAYDWVLNSKREFLVSARKLLGVEPAPETLALLNVIELLRSEGLASISARLNSGRDQQQSSSEIIYSIRNFFRRSMQAFKKEFSSGFILAFSHDVSSEFVTDSLNNISENGVCHDFGEYMAFVIFLSKMQDHLSFWESHTVTLKGFVNIHKRKLSSEQVAEKYKFKPIQYGSRVGEMLASNDWKLDFVVKKEDFHFAEQVLTAMNLMGGVQFFQAYVNACREMGIDAYPLDEDVFKKFDKDKKSQIKKLLKELSF